MSKKYACLSNRVRGKFSHFPPACVCVHVLCLYARACACVPVIVLQAEAEASMLAAQYDSVERDAAKLLAYSAGTLREACDHSTPSLGATHRSLPSSPLAGQCEAQLVYRTCVYLRAYRDHYRAGLSALERVSAEMEGLLINLHTQILTPPPATAWLKQVRSIARTGRTEVCSERDCHAQS